MLQRFKQYIHSHRLLDDSDNVLVGVSGGADSVALLYLLRACGYACEAAHCNFHLRGDESMRDQHFVEELCAKWRIPLHITDFATIDHAKTNGISIEMAARELRYEWFEHLRQNLDCKAIAVAHHQNDQAETLLLNLQRGTGIRGLGGMKPKNGYIIRPMLCFTRNEIEQLCQTHALDYVTDSTNSDTAFKRNAIRAILQQASDTDIHHYAEAAQRMQAYQQLVEALLFGTEICDEGQLALIYELLAPYGFNATQISDILAALPSSGKRFEAPSFTATIDHGQLTIRSRKPQEEQLPTLLRAIRPRMPKEHFPKATDDWALVDADKLTEPLSLRHWKAGDTFYPITSGKRIRKKLQDFFCDLKLSLAEKDAVWLLCSGEDIVWVIGYRLDDRYKVTADTKRIAELQIEA